MATSKAILHTRPDGGVNVTHPSPRCMRALTGGGYPWHLRGSTEAEQIERMVAQGTPEADAARWARALGRGGCTDAEAYGLIAWRSVPKEDTAADLVDLSEIPGDRWFRDAWGRSHNGGPILIRMDKARAVQRQRIVMALDLENARRRREWLEPLFIDFDPLRLAVAAAKGEAELRAVWPSALRPAGAPTPSAKVR